MSSVSPLRIYRCILGTLAKLSLWRLFPNRPDASFGSIQIMMCCRWTVSKPQLLQESVLIKPKAAPPPEASLPLLRSPDLFTLGLFKDNCYCCRRHWDQVSGPWQDQDFKPTNRVKTKTIRVRPGQDCVKTWTSLQHTVTDTGYMCRI